MNGAFRLGAVAAALRTPSPGAPGAPGASARYWRIRSLSIPGGGFLEVSEIGLYSGGVRQTGAILTSSVAPSTGPGSGPVSTLDDNNTSTRPYWDEATAEGAGFWVQWDFGTARFIDGFAQAGFDNSSRFIQSCLIECSDDAVYWEARARLSGLTYPGNFTFSAVIAVAVPLVVLQLPLNGVNGSTTFTDISPSPKTITANGNAQISTAQSRSGGASARFDGSGDFLSFSMSSSDLNFGAFSNDFTLELWYYPISAVASDRIFQTRNGDVVPGFYLAHNTATQLIFYVSNNGASFLGSGLAFNITQNSWNHVAIVNSGGTVRAYVNGIAAAGTYSITGSMHYNAADTMVIGGQTSGRSINGFLDEIRFTRNVARYTANFTPPSAPFPNP